MALRKKHRISLLFVLLLGLGACGDGSEYSAYQSISKEGMASTPYVFDLSDSSFEEKPYNFYIRLRNDNSYAFTNIFLICTLKAGNEFVLQDTLEYAMAAPRHLACRLLYWPVDCSGRLLWPIALADRSGPSKHAQR